MPTRPDVLVLGGGGLLGAAWMAGVLAGIEDAAGIDMRACEYFVGTSAGAILCALLAAGEPLERPGLARRPGGERGPHTVAGSRGSPEDPTTPGRAAQVAARAGAWALALGSPLAGLALRAGSPAGALARAAALRALPAAHRARPVAVRKRIEHCNVHFDGRLRIVAVERSSGRRTVFGQPGAPRASVPEAVEASCAVPWLFAPVRIGGREYVDGGVWSPTNLDAAPAGRGTQVLCLSPLATASEALSLGPLAMLARGATRSTIALEELALRRRGAIVLTLAPDRDAIAAIGADLMASRPRARVLTAGYRQGRAVSLRLP
jgi:NTE family protein